MNFITNNHNQMHLFGYSLNELVPKDAKSRFVLSLIKQLNLKKLYNRYSSQGNPAFEPSTMLATWFLAYSEGVTSTRKLEELCYRDLHYIYISSKLHPDHTSLSRFRKNHIDLMTDFFTQLVVMIKEQDIADFKDIAIDGSKIQAACSRKQSKTEDGIFRHIKAIRKQIKEYMQECEETEQEENTDLITLKKKIKHLQQLEKTLTNRNNQLSERKKQLKKENRKNHKINIQEPSARMMDKVNGYQKSPAYNVQISVDAKKQFIGSNEVVDKCNDKTQLKPQIKNLEKNLGKDEEREYTADSGYHNIEQLEYVADNKIKVFIADPSPNHRSRIKGKTRRRKNPQTILQEKEKFDRSDFIYDKKKNDYVCPTGEKMIFERRYKRKKAEGQTYKGECCNECKYVKGCLPENNKSGFRRIHRDDREDYAERMLEKMRTEYGKKKMKQRAVSVEPVFGNIKSNLGFRRFILKGFKAVQGEFNLMCIAHNINKMKILLDFLRKIYFNVKERIYTNLIPACFCR